MRYELDDLTAENGSVLGKLAEDTSPASLKLSPDLADELRRDIRRVNASLRMGMERTEYSTPRYPHIPLQVIAPPEI